MSPQVKLPEEWELVINPFGMPLTERLGTAAGLEEGDSRYVAISVRHWGVPVFVAEGPLKIRLEAGGLQALAQMMRDANRHRPRCPNEPHGSGLRYDVERDVLVCPLCGYEQYEEMGG